MMVKTNFGDKKVVILFYLQNSFWLSIDFILLIGVRKLMDQKLLFCKMITRNFVFFFWIIDLRNAYVKEYCFYKIG